jgi:hypothetical protein
MQLLQWAAPPPLARVTQAERRELRLALSSATGSESAIEGGSARALFEQCLLPLASGVDAAFVALWLHTFRLFTTPRSVSSTASASRCAASTRWRRSARGSATRSATRSCRARPGLLRARLVAAAALRERLSRRQRAVCRLAQLLAARRRCRFTASGQRTRRRPRKCPSTVATSSIQRAARCSTSIRLRSRGRRRWRRAPNLCSCDRAS